MVRGQHRQQQGATHLVVGLGNPGNEYLETRHNAGFRAADALADRLGAHYWKNQGGALVAIAQHSTQENAEEIVIAKPQTFMNLSGTAVKNLARKYGVEAKDIIVVHDELDIAPGDIRIKVGGGNAGHNGLKSIQAELGDPGFIRVRIGIGHPEGRYSGADYVLEVLKGDKLEDFSSDCNRATDVVLSILDDGVAAAMNRFNGAQRKKD